MSMTRDEELLLGAVCDSPQEDTPRLAYADLLDELGGEVNVARAEFIRTQIARDRSPGPGCGQFMYGCGELCPTLDALVEFGCEKCRPWAAVEKRLQNLWVTYGIHLTGPPPWVWLFRNELNSKIEPLGSPRLDWFSRGFLSRIELSRGQFTKFSAAWLFSRFPLEEVVLTDAAPLDNCVWLRGDVNGWVAPAWAFSPWVAIRGVWDRLDGYHSFGTGLGVRDGPNIKTYGNREDAIKALSRAAVSWGRSIRVRVSSYEGEPHVAVPRNG